MYWWSVMAKEYKPNPAGITALLQSSEMLALTEQYAHDRAGADGEIKPFIGFDRAKTIVYSTGRKN